MKKIAERLRSIAADLEREWFGSFKPERDLTTNADELKKLARLIERKHKQAVRLLPNRNVQKGRRLSSGL